MYGFDPSEIVHDNLTLKITNFTSSIIGYRSHAPTDTNWFAESLPPAIHSSTHLQVPHINDHMLPRAKIGHSKAKNLDSCGTSARQASSFSTWIAPSYATKIWCSISQSDLDFDHSLITSLCWWYTYHRFFSTLIHKLINFFHATFLLKILVCMSTY